MTRPKPSVDLGYPTPAHGRIPSCNDAEEEAAFLNTHSFTDFDEELTPTEIRVSRQLLAPLSVRLDPADRAAVVRLAHAGGIGPSALIRMWIKAHLRQEAEATASGR